ncbi:acrB/AcrD/AcrF family protein, partial [Vibrio parahaemolyticus V-223/04]
THITALFLWHIKSF